MLTEKLDREFDVENVVDEWQWLFDDLFIRKSEESFRRPQHHSGLAIKNSDKIDKIYTAFAPSKYVLEEIRRRGVRNSLLVVKHPFDWDGQWKVKFEDLDND